MNTWFISDTHFGHKNIIKYSKRPYSNVAEMDEALITNWNNLVRPGDKVYHLGDFAFGDEKYIRYLACRLNGSITLISGNHDKTIKRYCRDLFNHVPALDVDLNNTHFYLHHYGCRVWNKSHRGSIHLYGHSHGTLPPVGKSVDVGVDAKWITSEYRPISIDEILDYMKNRAISHEDYHE